MTETHDMEHVGPRQGGVEGVIVIDKSCRLYFVMALVSDGVG